MSSPCEHSLSVRPNNEADECSARGRAEGRGGTHLTVYVRGSPQPRGSLCSSPAEGGRRPLRAAGQTAPSGTSPAVQELHWQTPPSSLAVQIPEASKHYWSIPGAPGRVGGATSSSSPANEQIGLARPQPPMANEKQPKG